MSNQEHIDLLIDDYLKNRLTGDELDRFNQSLQSDESLRAKVQLHKLANELVINNKLNAIGDLSRQVASEIESKSRVKTYLISAVSVIILGAAVYLFTREKVVDGEKSSVIESVETPLVSPVSADSGQRHEPNTKSVSPTIKAENKQTPIIKQQTGGSGNPVSGLETEEKGLLNKENSVHDATPSTPSEVVSKPTGVPLEKNLCEDVTIAAEISTKGSCEGQGNGSIQILNISGGHSPYKTSIVDESGHNHGLMKGLKKGDYTVRLVDSRGCFREYLHVHIKEVGCKEDFHFNPFIGEIWELASNGHAAEFHVYEKSSGLYYEKSFQTNEQLHWNGQSNKGEIKEGYFVFEIIYSDGSRKNGSITVVK